MGNKQYHFELADHTGIARWVNSVRTAATRGKTLSLHVLDASEVAVVIRDTSPPRRIFG
jgi:hypothetical protein